MSGKRGRKRSRGHVGLSNVNRIGCKSSNGSGLTVADPPVQVILLNPSRTLQQKALASLALQERLPVLLLQNRSDVLKRRALEVVEHDYVGPGGDGLAGSVERGDLDLDSEGKTGDGSGGGDGLSYGAFLARRVKGGKEVGTGVESGSGWGCCKEREGTRVTPDAPFDQMWLSLSMTIDERSYR